MVQRHVRQALYLLGRDSLSNLIIKEAYNNVKIVTKYNFYLFLTIKVANHIISIDSLHYRHENASTMT